VQFKRLLFACLFFIGTEAGAQWTTSGSHIYNSNSGNVGIGTTSPGVKLDVSGSASFAGVVFKNYSSPGTLGSPVYENAFLYGASNTGYGAIQFGNEYAANLATSLKIRLTNQSNSTFDALTINSSGDVGIGTASPVVKLDVNGSASFAGAVHKNYSSPGTLGSPAYENAFSYGASNTGYGAIQFGNEYAANLATTLKIRLTNQSNSTFDALTISSSGNVGIGTTSTSDKLSVDGNVYSSGNISAFGFIKTKKLTVTQTAWPDYVFSKKYKLRSLSSLESFIKQNKHLPEVPSAKEVEERGISVGDNQALLLKKIEELTLYIIELNKKIDSLENNKKINIASVPIK
jgi:hypothetical protein